MKSFLLAASFLLIAGSSFANIVRVDVPAGDKVVELSKTVQQSGCEDSVSFLDVLKTERGYVAGDNVAEKYEGDVWLDDMPRIYPGPISSCTMVVKNITKVKFKLSSLNDRSIEVELPEFMIQGLEIEISDVKRAQ